MSYIEIKEHDPGVGMEYAATSYPGNGLYWIPRLNMYYAVSGGCCYSMAVGGRLQEITELPKPEAAFDPIAMLAVALHPETATRYITNK